MNNDQKERMAKANELLITIATYGRKFFEHNGRISEFRLNERGRLYFWDSYTQCMLPTSNTKTKKWGTHFTQGGTLKRLVEALIEYIRLDVQVNIGHFDFPPWYSNGDPWGYGDAMKQVRSKVVELKLANYHNNNYHPTD